MAKSLVPQLTSALVPPVYSGVAGQSPPQAIADFSKASSEKLQGELAAKLSSSKMASSFSKLSSGVDLLKSNNAIIAKVSGTGQTIGTVEDLPLNNIPASSLDQCDFASSTEKFKVMLTANPMLGDDHDSIVFDVMPSISENHSASYDSVDLIHHPGQILKYKGTEARTWGVTADLVSRTVQEADKNRNIINTIRSWLMPFYGQGSSTLPQFGGPPQVLTLTAYGSKMIGPSSCILENFSWTFENDMDYIHTSDGEPFPVHLKVSLSLKETWTPSQFTSFSLLEYRQGNMRGAFSGTPASVSAPAASVAPTGGIDTSSLTTTDPTQAALTTAGSAAASAVTAELPPISMPVRPVTASGFGWPFGGGG